MGMILRIASSRIVGQGDIVGRSGYFSLNLSANSVMRGRLDARRTLKSLVADLRWNTKAEQQTNLDSLLAKEARMGWQVLNNEHTIIHRGHDSIALVGVENSGNPPFPNYGDLPKALKGTDGIFKVLLSHDPTHWRREVLPESDVQLMLSGHTHEMQFSIFGFSPAKFVYPEHNGLYREGNQALFVNVGLGYLMFPMRLGAWPEITVITLKKE